MLGFIAFTLFVAFANAHFQLQFPPPRGVFVEDNEPKFCDGYTNAAANRSEFPLTNGFLSLNSEHPNWVAGVFISTLSNPQSPSDFKQILPFFSVAKGEGPFCVPLAFDFGNATGLTDGQNVTIQVSFNGGDGNLFQCADLTLSSNFTIPPSFTCTNVTGSSATFAQSSSSTTQQQPWHYKHFACAVAAVQGITTG